MGAYTLRRLGFLIIVVWGATTIVFLLSHIISGDPARVALGPDATQEMVDAYRRELGLDKPLLIQYGIYMSNLLRGDMGTSILTGRPVASELATFVPATLELMLASVVLSVVLAVPLGILSAMRQGSWLDHALRASSVAGLSLPIFWFGIILQLIFYRYLEWLPIGGRLAPDLPPMAAITGLHTIDGMLQGRWDVVGSAVLHLILPALSLSFINLAAISRITRSSMLDVLDKDFVRVARSKGLSERVVIYKHAFRNAVVPILTVIGLRVGAMFGGAVLTETVFAWPGLGRYAYYALRNVDLPVVAGFTLWTTLAYAVINLLVDVSYYVVDPRIRVGTGGS